jgi:hypothetical protein
VVAWVAERKGRVVARATTRKRSRIARNPHGIARWVAKSRNASVALMSSSESRIPALEAFGE